MEANTRKWGDARRSPPPSIFRVPTLSAFTLKRSGEVLKIDRLAFDRIKRLFLNILSEKS